MAGVCLSVCLLHFSACLWNVCVSLGELTMSNLISGNKLGQERPHGRRLCWDEQTSHCVNVPPVSECCNNEHDAFFDQLLVYAAFGWILVPSPFAPIGR